MNQLVSIIIPYFNCAEYIIQTLESVQRQTWKNWECIIVDDGSTDASEEIISEFKFKDERIRFIKQINSGPSSARNNGITHAQGEFLMFLDADDLLVPSKIERQLEVFAMNPSVGIVYCDGYCFTNRSDLTEFLDLPVPKPVEYGLINAKNMFRKLFFGNRFTIHAALIKHDVLRAFGKFDESLWAHEDHELWLRLSKNGVNFYSMPEKMVWYRRYETSHSVDPIKMRIGESKALTLNKETPFIGARAILAKERNLYKWLVRDLIRAKRFNDAKKYLWEYFERCKSGNCALWLRWIALWIRIFITKQ